ncbi:HisA/HisF-related TIM barrel protein [Aquabacterium sp.]|uniref:HisA/HisF-related TIM barrel protein n=1 Tax=Aquabacterium sp. TaxID=1872578 RepID=UPI002C0C65BC|nr:HisA/HisF-related TIM barrel protein [Aquabacterium sp.]HSW08762.1 HisA/HisF-related TIM barrel protein [Aquabacterium sp.]
MILIPVVDLLQGQVVRAVAGNRSAYRPIVSGLCQGSDLLTVAQTLCEHCASSQLYLADLDALQGGPVQLAQLRTLLEALPDLQLWLDAGFADAAAAESLRGQLGPLADRVVFVFGSESLHSRAALAECFDPLQPGSAGRVLSLDRRGGQRLDAAGCWDAVDLWPRRVIVMTLERVGSDAGPDLDTLRELRAKAPGAMLIGAGGIRHEADLAAAQQAGADAWLVASALHDGRLPRRIR